MNISELLQLYDSFCIHFLPLDMAVLLHRNQKKEKSIYEYFIFDITRCERREKNCA